MVRKLEGYIELGGALGQDWTIIIQNSSTDHFHKLDSIYICNDWMKFNRISKLKNVYMFTGFKHLYVVSLATEQY
jgi:hypothetical protein